MRAGLREPSAGLRAALREEAAGLREPSAALRAALREEAAALRCGGPLSFLKKC